jgi:hypothetical protein
MALATTRHAARRAGGRSWRALAVLILMAASLLLAVPGAATAHVQAKYQDEYTQTLASFRSGFSTYSKKYDTTKAHEASLAETLAPMIGDPAQHDQLVRGEQYAATIYEKGKELPALWQKAISKKIDAFIARAPKYFASSKERRIFKKQAGLLKPDFGCVVYYGHYNLYLAFQALSTDPPDLALAAAKVAIGDNNVKLGRTEFAAQMAVLRNLL